MILPIYTYGEEILRKKAEDVNLEDEEIQHVIDNMFETMTNANGAGLAAPQIGLSKKIIVIDEMLTPREHFRGVFINAKILDTFGADVHGPEGCLSFPGISGTVKRKESIYVEWYDENKTYYKSVFHNMRALILQHEIDHTNGILMIDRMNYRDKIKQFSQLENIRKKKALTNYPIV